MPDNMIGERESASAVQRTIRPRVLGIVLAGGKGTRLFPLTRERAKPAVPFGGKYRIIDFVLSNFVNSGINSIYVLTQRAGTTSAKRLPSFTAARIWTRRSLLCRSSSSWLQPIRGCSAP
jgi:hypothetical protein